MCHQSHFSWERMCSFGPEKKIMHCFLVLLHYVLTRRLLDRQVPVLVTSVHQSEQAHWGNVLLLQREVFWCVQTTTGIGCSSEPLIGAWRAAVGPRAAQWATLLLGHRATADFFLLTESQDLCHMFNFIYQSIYRLLVPHGFWKLVFRGLKLRYCFLKYVGNLWNPLYWKNGELCIITIHHFDHVVFPNTKRK